MTSSPAWNSSPNSSRRRRLSSRIWKPRSTRALLSTSCRCRCASITSASPTRSVLANITVQFENKDLQFQAKDGVEKSVDQSVRARHYHDPPPGHHFRETARNRRFRPSCCRRLTQNRSIYQQSVPLAPGRYRLNVVAKDIIGGNMNNYEVALDVPHFEEEKLASSSLILADDISRLPTKSIGGGMFAIGDTKVRPRLGNTFKRDEKMGIYLQVYNFRRTKRHRNRPARSLTRSIKWAPRRSCLDFTEDISKLPNASANQVTIEKLLPLKNMRARDLHAEGQSDRIRERTRPCRFSQTNFTVN